MNRREQHLSVVGDTNDRFQRVCVVLCCDDINTDVNVAVQTFMNINGREDNNL